MKIKGSKIRFAVNAGLAIASLCVAVAFFWQVITQGQIENTMSHWAGIAMGVAWTIVMAMHADCHRRGLPEID